MRPDASATEPTTLEEAKKVIARQAGRWAEDAAGRKVPAALGHGIAGLVAATGQPMAASNVQDEHRLVEEIGDTLGYEPQSVMAAPLSYGDRVVGVLELLDKEADTSFSASDLHALALFGHQAAVALELSRRYRHLARWSQRSLPPSTTSTSRGSLHSGSDRTPSGATLRTSRLMRRRWSSRSSCS